MMRLVQTVFQRGKIRQTPRLNVHLDQYRVYFLNVAERFFTENQQLHGSHPPRTPDLAPSDFWLFDRIKIDLIGRTFTKPEELP
jgi:hypothetical protein